MVVGRNLSFKHLNSQSQKLLYPGIWYSLASCNFTRPGASEVSSSLGTCAKAISQSTGGRAKHSNISLFQQLFCTGKKLRNPTEQNGWPICCVCPVGSQVWKWKKSRRNPTEAYQAHKSWSVGRLLWLGGWQRRPCILPGALVLDLHGSSRDLGSSLEPRGQCWGWLVSRLQVWKVTQVKLQLRECGSCLSTWVSKTGFENRDELNLSVGNISGLNCEQLRGGGRRTGKFTILELSLGKMSKRWCVRSL